MAAELADRVTNRKKNEFDHSEMAQYSKYQQNIIKNYYENRDAIALQRVQEMVTELYLAEGKKRAKLWNSLPGHLEKLGISQGEIENVVAQEKPELVAKLVERVMGKQ